MKIIEYKTAHGKEIPSLDENVNFLISQGFEPFGSQYFAAWPEDTDVVDSNGFFQPMVKKQPSV